MADDKIAAPNYPRVAKHVKPRLELVEKLMIKGYSRSEIVTEVQKYYDVSAVAVDYYVRKVREFRNIEHLAVVHRLEKAESKDNMREELWSLYTIARRDCKYRECVNILDRLCKLDGLYTPEQVDVQVSSNVIVVPQQQRTVDAWLEVNEALQLEAADENGSGE